MSSRLFISVTILHLDCIYFDKIYTTYIKSDTHIVSFFSIYLCVFFWFSKQQQARMDPQMGIPPSSGNDEQAQVGNGVWDKVKSFLPDMSNLYLEPLDPRSDISTLGDRAGLIWKSARPWREFLDFSAFNLPPFDQVKIRASQNIETYFYNYFLLTCIHVIFFAMGHFWSFFWISLWIALTVYLLVLRDEDFEIRDTLIDRKKKIAIIAIVGVIAVFFGHALTFVISLMVFLLIVVGIHSIIRDNTMYDDEPMIPTV